LTKSIAPGGPGLPPRWTRGAKEAVGTAYSAASRVWYTVASGILTEVFYPTIDTPQIRDLQMLVTDGRTFFHDERRNTRSTVACLDDVALGFDIVNVAENGLYRIHKTLIGAPHHDCVLVRTAIEAAPDVLRTLQAYVLCAPHLEIGGWHNNAETLDTKGGPIVVAYKGGTWMALGATAPVLRRSCGYVAVNDGWTDLHDNLAMDWQYEAAYDGNVAVTMQVDISRGEPFTIALAFGDTRHRAVTNLFQATAVPFDTALLHFRREWQRTARRFALAANAENRRASLLYERSVNLLLAHEDKSYPGAIIAAMSIPWGSSKGDEEMGGYHLVWTRDLVQAATALLAAGDTVTPLRAAGVPRDLAASGRRLLPELLDRRPAVLERGAARRGVVSDRACVAAERGRRPRRVQPDRDGCGGVRVSDPRRARDRAGTLGGGGRVFALDARHRDRRAHLRRGVDRARRRRGDCRLHPGLRGFPRAAHRDVDRDDVRHARAGCPAALYPHQPERGRP
jgi:hypothetical protein